MLRRILQRQVLDEQDRRLIVRSVYLANLDRLPDALGEQEYSDALRKGLSVRSFVDIIVASEEFRKRNGLAAQTPPTSSDCIVMGTNIRLTRQTWEDRRREIARQPIAPPAAPVPLAERRFRHSGAFDVTAIASLYMGGRYLENFLENLTSQTNFDRAELIFIDACSPGGEAELIQRYQAVYPNIVYRRINFRIGVYEAWNEAIGLARGRFLTNTNLDDLRRRDCLELQAAALDRNPGVDVVYQDVLYTLDPPSTFDAAERFGFRSRTQPVTFDTLLITNWPHSAPMWRKRLHDEFGLFDQSYRSAGDYEFWLRCLHRGKSFLRLDEALAVYYHNPEGVSTAALSQGDEEGVRIQRAYMRKFGIH